MESKTLVPGAGSYEIKSKDFDRRSRFHMGLKIVFDDTKKYIHSLPGPGTHDPSTVITK